MVAAASGVQFIGLRVCPNAACGLVLLVFLNGHRELIESYPPETIDFDTTNLPPAVVAALEEAIQCHAIACYRASALMVRRTLEELCLDRNASGPNLKDRISALGSSVVLPKELLGGLDTLRLLGNDAAHIEARVFEEIGREEIELALDVTKEVLKAVYQYSSLIDRLNARRSAPNT